MALTLTCRCPACRSAGPFVLCEWPACHRPAEIASHREGLPVLVCPDHADALARESVPV